ncbi:MAG: hypothetical protein ABI675_31020, partial [Chitinophagaceae bacterium]
DANKSSLCHRKYCAGLLQDFHRNTWKPSIVLKGTYKYDSVIRNIIGVHLFILYGEVMHAGVSEGLEQAYP